MQKWFICGMACLLWIGLAACQSEISVTTIVPPTETLALIAFTPIPTVAIQPTHTPTRHSTSTPVVTSSATPSFTPTPSLTATQTATLSSMSSVVRRDHYWLSRPIARSEFLVDWIDRTYPYGGTQFGAREVHLGVEFVNPRFTPVLAAADGVIYYAGDDRQKQFGPMTDYYGNLVVIEHNVQTYDGLNLYTLYGHLQSISVNTGQMVAQGERIGQVGDTGIAIGPHLHFEVRVGDPNDWRNTRNPELWLIPYPRFGTLAGRVRDSRGNYLQGMVLLVRADNFSRETYTYGGDEVNRDTFWDENFTLGDLPVGQYDVIISTEQGKIRFKEQVTIQSGQTTWLDINLD